MDFRNNNCSYLDFRAELPDLLNNLSNRWKKFGSINIKIKWNGIPTDELDMLLKCGINPLSYDRLTGILHCQYLAKGYFLDITHDHRDPNSTVVMAIRYWCKTYGDEYKEQFRSTFDKLDATIQQKISSLNTHGMQAKKSKNKPTWKGTNNTVFDDLIDYNKDIYKYNGHILEKNYKYPQIPEDEDTQSDINRILTELGKKRPRISDTMKKCKNTPQTPEGEDAKSDINRILTELGKIMKKAGQLNRAKADNKYYIIEFADRSDAMNTHVAIASRCRGYYRILAREDRRLVPEDYVITSRMVSDSMYPFFIDDTVAHESDPVEALIDAIKAAKDIAFFILNQDGEDDD